MHQHRDAVAVHVVHVQAVGGQVVRDRVQAGRQLLRAHGRDDDGRPSSICSLSPACNWSASVQSLVVTSQQRWWAVPSIAQLMPPDLTAAWVQASSSLVTMPVVTKALLVLRARSTASRGSTYVAPL